MVKHLIFMQQVSILSHISQIWIVQRTRIQLFHVIPQETVNVKTVNHRVLHNIHLLASPIAFIALCPTFHGHITRSLSNVRRLNVRTWCPCEIKTRQLNAPRRGVSVRWSTTSASLIMWNDVDMQKPADCHWDSMLDVGNFYFWKMEINGEYNDENSN